MLFPFLKSLVSGATPQAYLVGGFVRDALLGRPTRDIDLAVRGDPFALARSLADRAGGAFVPLDPERGVARAVLPSPDGPWWVDFSALRGPDIGADLAERDFTINALAVPLEALGTPPSSWPVIDPFGGREDLRRGLLRAVSLRAFREDPVRLLRAFRLSCQFGFALEGGTRALLEQEAPLIARTAPERVREEFLRLLSLPASAPALREMDRAGLLCAIIPELAWSKGVSQPPEHAYDVFDHALETVGAAERLLDPTARAGDPFLALVPWEPWLEEHFAREVSDGGTRATFLKVAGLLHDVAKPLTRSVEPSGRMRFLGHQNRGAEIAGEVLRRLRVGNRGVEAVATMVRGHLRPAHLGPPGAPPTPRAVYRFFRDLGEVAVDTLYLSLADYLGARGPLLEREEWEEYCRRIGEALRLGTTRASPPRLPKLVDGHDLQEVFGLRPGPLFRDLLEALREAQASGEVRHREEALAYLRRLLEERGLLVKGGHGPA